jgi:hypothetical protein
MPVLLKTINASFLDLYDSNLIYYSTLTSDIQKDIYINLPGFVAFLQNFTYVQTINSLNTPMNFGYKIASNTKIKKIGISYK